MSVESVGVFDGCTKLKEGDPLFRSYDDYKRYCKRLYKKIRPAIEENRRRRIRSWLAVKDKVFY